MILLLFINNLFSLKLIECIGMFLLKVTIFSEPIDNIILKIN